MTGLHLPPAQGANNATLDEFRKTLARRGVSWKFMIGRATKGPNGQGMFLGPNVPIVLDGDTAAVNAQSLIGPIASSESVAIIFVPPAGYYIVGHTDGSNVDGGWLDFVNVLTMSVTTTGTTEADLSPLALTAYVIANRQYEIWFQALLAQTLASDRFTIQLRQDTTAGTILGNAVIGAVALNNAIMFPIKATATKITNFRISIQRNLGTGTVTASGSPGSGVVRSWSGIKQGVRGGVIRTI